MSASDAVRTDAPVVVTPEGPAPDALLEAFWAYERALADDDVPALDAFFVPGDGTTRGDAAGLLVGHATVGAFRVARGGAPQRRIRDVHVHVAGPGSAVVQAVTVRGQGGHGLQTQLWERDGDGGPGAGWRIAAAQVAAPPGTLDPAVWSVVGTPLVPPTADGPLRGVGVAVKDLFAVAGHPVGAGVPAYRASAAVETEHASAVARLLAAGAAVTGIARTDQFAYSIMGLNPHYGAPVNAAVAGALPGGSTSGSATAVALGDADLGLGTDTGGSVRVPASYQGLWGIRTTHGSVDASGLLPLAPDFDAVGLLARDPVRLRRATEVLVGAVSSTEADGPLLVAPALLSRVDPEVAQDFSRARALLGDVREISVPSLDALVEAFRVHQAWQAWGQHGEWITAHPGAVVGDVADRFETGSRVSEAEDAAAVGHLAVLGHELDDALADGVLLLPSTPSSAPKVWDSPGRLDAVRGATLRLTCVAGVTGRPAVSVPVLSVPASGPGRDPVGLCLVGPRGSDVALVARAAELAEVLLRSSSPGA